MTDPVSPLVLLVGHCTPDAWMLRTAVGRVDAGLELEAVNEHGDLSEHVAANRRPLVLLVNRKLDGRFDAADGIELIRGLEGAAVVPVLVSDLAEAHEEAATVGGHPGFGKRALNDEATSSTIRDAIALATDRHRASV